MTTKEKQSLIETLINESVIDFGKRHSYHKEFFDLFLYLKEKSHKYVSKNLKGKMDYRSFDEYHRNIALSWVVEDFLIEHSNGKLRNFGCDSKRKFLTKGITNTGDLISKDGTIYEVVCHYHGTEKFQQINLRQDKLMHLREQNAVLVIVDVKNKSVFIKPARKFPFYKIDSLKIYGGKPAYRIYLNDDVDKFVPIENVHTFF